MTLALIAAALASAPGAPLASREVDEDEKPPCAPPRSPSPAELERITRAEEKRQRRARARMDRTPKPVYYVPAQRGGESWPPDTDGTLETVVTLIDDEIMQDLERLRAEVNS